MDLRLPPGYRLELDAETAVLREGEDGRLVAIFSVRGVVWETLERSAWEDHRGRNSTEASERRPTPTLGRPPSPPRPLG